MEQAMLSAQAANTNQIRELEKQVASVTTEL
jgi:ribosomal protein L29